MDLLLVAAASVGFTLMALVLVTSWLRPARERHHDPLVPDPSHEERMYLDDLFPGRPPRGGPSAPATAPRVASLEVVRRTRA